MYITPADNKLKGNAMTKLTKCPKCGADDYSTYNVKPGEGDPSKTYSICNTCQTEFDGAVDFDPCPDCGSHEIDWVHTQSNGHDVSYMMCLNCDNQFGGDL
jgi:DNA-directed RNA polymerase subunit M/transcription elongation factor TFIIS